MRKQTDKELEEERRRTMQEQARLDRETAAVKVHKQQSDLIRIFFWVFYKNEHYTYKLISFLS